MRPWQKPGQKDEGTRERPPMRRSPRGSGFPIGRHITAALEYLAHELIAGQTYSDRVERRPSLAAAFTEGMAVVTLFRLEDKRPLDLKRRSSAYEFRRDGSSGPSVHYWTPRRMAGQIGE